MTRGAEINEIFGRPENKEPGLWRTLEDPGLLKTQDPRRPRTLEDPAP